MSDVLLICPNVLDVTIHPIFDEIEPLLLELAKQRGLVGLARGSVVPPTELLSLSSYLIDSGISVSVLDLTLEVLRGNNLEESIKRTLKKENPKIVGIRANEICFINQYLQLASLVRGYNSNILIVLGGVAATGYNKELLSTKNFDVIVRGEGELTFLELCQKFLSEKSIYDVKGLSYLSTDRTIRTPDRELIDLVSLPLPYRSIYPLKELYKLNGGIDLIYASRGCPCNCSFCNAPYFWKCKWRERNPIDIVTELKLIEENGAKIAHIHDVNFGVNVGWIKKLCKLIKDSGLKILWDCQLRVDYLKKEVLTVLYKGNCRGAFIGIESASQDSLDGSNKNYSNRILISALKKAKQVGVHIDGGYVVGLPDDTLKSLEATKKLAVNLLKKDLVETPVYFLFIPWKGTYIGDNLPKIGIKIENNNLKYWHGFTSKPIASTKSVDAKIVYSFWESGWYEMKDVLYQKVHEK